MSEGLRVVEEQRPVSLIPLWAGILGPPAAWAAQLLVAYSPVELLCGPESSGDVWGMGLNAFGVITTVVAVVVTVVCGVAAERARRTLGGLDASPAVARSTFMARLGVLSAIYFLLVILLTVVGPIAIEGCRR